MRKTSEPELNFHPEFCQDTLCHSDTAQQCGLDNTCPPGLLNNLSRLSALLGEIQQYLNIPPGALKINSGFRAEALNEKVGGVPNSQHCLGLAADIVCGEFDSAHALACAIEHSPCEYDQLILEFGKWVHVSAAPEDRAPRRQCLSIFSKNEGYLEGIVKR
ncbi:MAG TPA: D-Ala-D-Ala carboxypeptidase family metallohydrolase [Limnobacter sp.]|nr:D-Ala-D-Ala carboxypeptidase family metallohydrolase [Limnobacter sp.]